MDVDGVKVKLTATTNEDFEYLEGEVGTLFASVGQRFCFERNNGKRLLSSKIAEIEFPIGDKIKISTKNSTYFFKKIDL